MTKTEILRERLGNFYCGFVCGFLPAPDNCMYCEAYQNLNGEDICKAGQDFARELSKTLKESGLKFVPDSFAYYFPIIEEIEEALWK